MRCWSRPKEMHVKQQICINQNPRSKEEEEEEKAKKTNTKIIDRNRFKWNGIYRNELQIAIPMDQFLSFD